MNKRLLIITFIFLLIFVVKLNMSYYDDYQTSLLPGIFIQDKGSDLISKDLIKEGNYAGLTSKVQKLVGIIAKLRQ